MCMHPSKGMSSSATICTAIIDHSTLQCIDYRYVVVRRGLQLWRNVTHLVFSSCCSFCNIGSWKDRCCCGTLKGIHRRIRRRIRSGHRGLCAVLVTNNEYPQQEYGMGTIMFLVRLSPLTSHSPHVPVSYQPGRVYHVVVENVQA